MRGLAAVAGTALCLRATVLKLFFQCDQNNCSADIYLIINFTVSASDRPLPFTVVSL